MTNHDEGWGILRSQQDEDEARGAAVADPARYHTSIAARELHWFDATGEQWLSRATQGDWQGWHASSGALASADTAWTQLLDRLRWVIFPLVCGRQFFMSVLHATSIEAGDLV